MRFEKFEDVNFGFVFHVPSGWSELNTGIPNMWLFSNSDGSVGLFLYVLDHETNFGDDLDGFVFELSFRIFGSRSDSVRLVDHRVVNYASCFVFEVFWRDDPSVFVLEPCVVTVHHNFSSLNFSERFVVGVTYDKNISDEAMLLVGELKGNLLNLVMKRPSPIGFNVPFVRRSFSYDFFGIRCEKWSMVMPATWRIVEEHDGFLAVAGGCLVGVNPYFSLLSGDLSQLDVEVFLGAISSKYFGKSVEKVDVKILEGSKAEALGFLDGGSITVYARVDVRAMFNASGEKVFVPVVRFAVYPSWLRDVFLPIAIASLESWNPGACFMSEVLGYSNVPASTSLTVPRVKSVPEFGKMGKRGGKNVSKALSSGESETFRRFREKLRGDLKRMADWEEKLWSETYQVIKRSDVITGMYTMEDKHKRKMFVKTDHVASPYTHNFWKHNKDVTNRLVVATGKPFTPKNRWEWEKLKWHWDEETKRIKEETEKKKKQIDKMFE
ncbi:MAG: hypothetical protein ACP6IP_05860 [Candidatus Njordarchaeia archaeon]